MPHNNFILHPDSTAADSVFSAIYPDGIVPDSVCGHSHLIEVANIPVIEHHKPLNAVEPEFSTFFSSGTSMLLSIAFLLVAFSFRRGFQYLSTIIRNLFSLNMHNDVFKDRTINETLVITNLIANTCISGGIILYFLLCSNGMLYIAAHNSIVPVLVCIATCASLILFQLLAYKVLAFTFSDHEHSKLWIDGNNASLAIVGFTFIPLAIMASIGSGATITAMAIVALILFFSSRFVFIIKGFRIFFKKIPMLFPFILYLCAIEIVPVLFFIAAAVNLCNYLQS
ncbi:MAG: DUF4271 domain-containing protein [Muribaculaceae bacterium]